MDALRIQVPHELFAPAESSHFEGSIAIPVMKAGPDLYDFAGPLAWQADISNTDEVSFPVTGEIEGYFLLDETKAAPEDMDEDEFDVLPADKVIDLEPLITAALLLEFPLIPLCDEECKGLCPQCGANLNEGPCGCEPAADDDDDMPPNPFAALKDFPFDEPQN